MRAGKSRAHADGRLSVVLRVRGLPRDPATEARRLLCVLLLWFSAVPAGSRAWQAGWLLRLIRRTQSAPSQLPQAGRRRPDPPRARPGVVRVAALTRNGTDDKKNNNTDKCHEMRSVNAIGLEIITHATTIRQVYGGNNMLHKCLSLHLLTIFLDYTAIIPQDFHPDS